MTPRNRRLDRIHIPTPCSVGWDQMEGDETVRFCAECNKNVYDLSMMTARQAEALVEASKGRLCLRITRSPDGSVRTLEKPVPWEPDSRRASPLASVFLTAIVGMNPSAAAQQLLTDKPAATINSESVHDKETEKRFQATGKGSISGTVVTWDGASVPSAKVTLIFEETGEQFSIVSSDTGQYRFAQLSAGSYTLKVEGTGLSPYQNSAIQLRDGEERRLGVAMRPPVTFAGGAVIAPLSLRKLFELSDLVVVATVGKSKRVETDGNRRLFETKLNDSYIVKGNSGKSEITVYGWSYKEEPEKFKTGEKLLLFLDHRLPDVESKIKGGFEVAILGTGIKRLSEEDLPIYLQRLDELSSILQKPNPDNKEIVEWLVRCIEQPATRPEGAEELAAAARHLQEEASAEDNELAEEIKGLSGTDVPAISRSREVEAEPNFATLLTQAQKERIKNAFFAIEKLTATDYDLIKIMRLWKDDRLVPHLVSQLQGMESAPSALAEELVVWTAKLIEDDEVRQYSEAYIANASYEDLDEPDERGSQEEAELAQEAARTALQSRSSALQKFLALVERKTKR